MFVSITAHPIRLVRVQPRPVAGSILLAGRFRFACRFRFRFFLPAESSFAYRPVSGLHTGRFPDLLIGRFPDLFTGQFPVLGNLATIIHQDKVAKVLLAQMKMRDSRCLCSQGLKVPIYVG